MYKFLNNFNINKNAIYLDYAASTPIDFRISSNMEHWQNQYFANPANFFHILGDQARHALESARLELANLFNLSSEEIIFTSSATESNNLLLRGLIEHPLQKRKKIISCVTEHSSISKTVKILEENFSHNLGIQFCELLVDHNGQINLEIAKNLIDEKTLCVCVMDVNNETGILQKTLIDIERLVHNCGALLHIDAVQGFARNDNFALGINYDTASISSGKIYGPKGAAALIIKKKRPRILITPQLTGGGQEFRLRSSTPNIPAILGFVQACVLQKQECFERLQYYAKLEKLFIDTIQKEIDVQFYGLNTDKVSGILSLTIPNVNAMKLLESTKIICASTGSACQTFQSTASHVLLSMGVELENALSSFRISFGLGNTEEEVFLAAKLLAVNAYKMKKISNY